MSLLGLGWGILLLVIIIVVLYNKKNVFHPIVFFLAFQFIEYALPLIINRPSWYIDYSSQNILSLITKESVFVISVCIGYYFSKGNWKKIIFGNHILLSNESINVNMYTSSRSYFSVYVLFGIGFASRIYMIQKMGGILYVFANSHSAYSSQISGAGLTSVLARLMLIAIVCYYEKIIIDNKFADKIVWIMMLVIYMGSYLIYSSRGPALEVILVLLCCNSMNKKQISFSEIIKPKYLVILAALVIVATVALSKRIGNTGANKDVIYYLSTITNEFNRADRDIATYNYFNGHSHWFGIIYRSIFYMFIPSSVCPNKPVLDDGFFLTKMIYGQNVDPSWGRLQLDLTIGSTPFTSQGMLFANFGILGLILGGLLLGIIYKRAYINVLRQNNTISTLIYFYVIYMFGFTPLYIQNFVSVILFSYVGRKIIFRKSTKE